MDNFTSTVDGAAGYERAHAPEPHDDRPSLADVADLGSHEGGDRTALRILAAWLEGTAPTNVGILIRDLREEGYTLAEVGALVGDPISREDDCPECPTGTVVSVGRMERDTGHQPGACDANCGYWG